MKSSWAAVLLVLYAAVTTRGLQRHKRLHEESGASAGEGWTLPTALAVLAVATAATAFVSEILVHSLHAFADAAGLSEFFTAAVVVAIVGNAAEHGGAAVIAHRGNLRLATEIAVSSSAQAASASAPTGCRSPAGTTRWAARASMTGPPARRLRSPPPTSVARSRGSGDRPARS